MIIYNPDINAVIETIKLLNKNDDVEFIEDDVDTSNNKYVFKNQRSHTLAREYLDKEFGGVPTSTFNTLEILFSTLNLFVIMLFLVGLINQNQWIIY